MSSRQPGHVGQDVPRTLSLPGGLPLPTLGLGTWRMGERPAERKAEVAALKLGIDLGMTLIDTAEMYGSGGAEQVVAEAIAGQRDRISLVSKVLPQNASLRGTLRACEASLQRLGTDYLDLYLLHWRGPHPLEDTFTALHQLRASGKIRAFGVSNFDRADMQEASQLDRGLTAANQVLYHLGARGIEFDLLPWQRSRGILLMAYSPFDQGRLTRKPALRRIAEQIGVTPAQLALAWLLHQPGVSAIPKSADLARVRENRAAHDLMLSAETLAAMDAAFPPPRGATPLAML